MDGLGVGPDVGGDEHGAVVSFQPLMVSIFVAKRPDWRSLEGASGMKGLGATGCQIRRASGLRLSSYTLTMGSKKLSGIDRRHSSSAAESEEVQLTFCTMTVVWLAQMSPVVPITEVDLPDCMMARWKGTGTEPPERVDLVANRKGASRFAKNGYVVRVTAEEMEVVADPLQTKALVVEPSI